MAIQDFTAGQVLTAAQMDSLQANDYNWTVSTKTASYTLVAADKGTRVVMNAAGATTITVNDSLFNAGDTLFIQNTGAGGTCTITAGTATVTTAGSLALGAWAGGTLYFTSASAAVFFSGAASTIDVDYLVIAGGGSASTSRGGGGGAGGYRNSVSGETTGGGGSNETSLKLLRNTNYAVQVGAGGSAAVSGSVGINGNFSQFFNIVATGGGGGGIEVAAIRNGLSGGSGGGGSSTSTGNGTGGAATTVPVQGYAGGNGLYTSDNAGGGGGGAGALGANATSLTGGAGGNGLSSSITGSAVTRGGGGGGMSNTGGAGGTGGGTAGNSNLPGTANTGGGSGSSNPPQAGGSGVVILRYADTLTITIGAGLTGTESAASGGYKRATITAGAGNVSWA